jgi:geranylgeranyl diphosphate synthase type II
MNEQLELALGKVLKSATQSPAPPKLAASMDYAIFPGGARVRPQLSLAVAKACGLDSPRLAMASAVSVEFMHCASLIHDDLPAFDNADTRRGKPSVHKAFDEPLAVLCGDALIVLAFECLVDASSDFPRRLGPMIKVLSKSSGMPFGICSGQGWESEKTIDLSAYHKLKTASLFVAATQMGAISAGEDPEPWAELGTRIGEAFQVADDLKDFSEIKSSGKSNNKDKENDRPNAVLKLGEKGAISRLQDILAGAIASIPACPGEVELIKIVRNQAERLTPVQPLQKSL